MPRAAIVAPRALPAPLSQGAGQAVARARDRVFPTRRGCGPGFPRLPLTEAQDRERQCSSTASGTRRPVVATRRQSDQGGQAVRVVPSLAAVAVGFPVRHRGAGGLKALGLFRRVQRRSQRQSLDHGGDLRAGPAAAQARDHLIDRHRFLYNQFGDPELCAIRPGDCPRGPMAGAAPAGGALYVAGAARRFASTGQMLLPRAIRRATGDHRPLWTHAVSHHGVGTKSGAV